MACIEMENDGSSLIVCLVFLLKVLSILLSTNAKVIFYSAAKDCR